MGGSKTSMNSMTFNEKSLKRDFSEFNDSMNKYSRDERDYMINKAMRKLNISDKWRKAVARGACYLSGDKFWQLVSCAESPRIKRKSNYFIASIGRELKK